ncbi:prefoldin subunit 3-like isoform X1 [Clytia hemisphaerica]|uniref:Prefoldin subunit 3 n=2 Tax=Clytia hemisphaerica TaxID=252671 RepID=A0A7M5UX36_9CNID
MSEVDTKKRHRGIPEATFLEDVEEFMKKEESFESALRKLDEQYQKYKFMESNLVQKKVRLNGQIPDIKSTLNSIKCLKSKKDSDKSLSTQFMLSDQLYVNAKVPVTKKVCLWLGANVMLEYDIEDAEKLLQKNLTTAETNLEELSDDLCFLRDQITTTEVSMARVYNFDVKKRQQQKAVAATT